MTEPIQIRPLTAADAAASLAIYNQAVVESVASWDWSPLSEQDWRDWLEQHASGRQVALVATAGAEVLGFAAYGPFRTKAGYRDTVEDSIYLRPEARGQGLGARLLGQLTEQAASRGLHVMVAALAAENLASIRLHAKLGFAETGRLPQVGQKFGRWLDLVLMTRRLDRRPSPTPA
ncbi:MAG: GNAT family N-acetyltransferase [Propionibacteriaceae bacterium]|nr:GNAT family N-acetyltransferase [Propionibacteriaceae bacterium]